MFDSTTTYTQGGVDVGTTQYDDAFQRGNFWSIVQNNPNYAHSVGWSYGSHQRFARTHAERAFGKR